MTREQKEHILRGLPKNSPVKYLGLGLPHLTNHTGYKLYNGRASNIHSMCVMIGGAKRWYLQYKHLTCKAIEVIERLEQTTKTPSK